MAIVSQKVRTTTLTMGSGGSYNTGRRYPAPSGNLMYPADRAVMPTPPEDFGFLDYSHPIVFTPYHLFTGQDTNDYGFIPPAHGWYANRLWSVAVSEATDEGGFLIKRVQVTYSRSDEVLDTAEGDIDLNMSAPVTQYFQPYPETNTLTIGIQPFYTEPYATILWANEEWAISIITMGPNAEGAGVGRGAFLIKTYVDTSKPIEMFSAFTPVMPGTTDVYRLHPRTRGIFNYHTDTYNMFSQQDPISEAPWSDTNKYLYTFKAQDMTATPTFTKDVITLSDPDDNEMWVLRHDEVSGQILDPVQAMVATRWGWYVTAISGEFEVISMDPLIIGVTDYQMKYFHFSLDFSVYEEIILEGADADAEAMLTYNYALGDWNEGGGSRTAYIGSTPDGRVLFYGMDPETIDNPVLTDRLDRVLNGDLIEDYSDWFLPNLYVPPNSYRVRAFPFSLDGHDYYVLHLGQQSTVVYDLTTGQWAEWGSPDLPYWRLNYGFNWLSMPGSAYTSGNTSNALCGDFLNGQLWTLKPEQGYDEDLMTGEAIPFTRRVVGGVPMRLRETQKVGAAYVTASIGVPSLTGAEITLRTSDDNGYTWTDHGTITATADDYDQEYVWRSLGLIKAPGRIFEITDTGATVRIDGLDIR